MTNMKPKAGTEPNEMQGEEDKNHMQKWINKRNFVKHLACNVISQYSQISALAHILRHLCMRKQAMNAF